jgi:uncharacterized DUF497 family protein
MMQLQFDSDIVNWFSRWPEEFDWDEGNIEKNKKHGIEYFEIEKIFKSPFYIAGRIVQTEEEPRWLVLGEVKSKGWALIITTRDQKLRVISCRRQREKEAKFYESIKKENEG